MLRPLIACLLLGLSAHAAADEHLIPRSTLELYESEYSGEAAREYIQRIVQYHRIQGSPMMAEVSTHVVLERLQAAGVKGYTETFPSDGRTRYQSLLSPMSWSMRSGELWIEEARGPGGAPIRPLRLCRYADVPMCVSTYSKGGTFAGELVDVGPGTSARDYEGKDVRGRVALASGYAGAVMRQAVLKYGAVGVVIYPDARDRPDQPDLIRYNGIWPRADEVERTSGGFQISANQYAQLRTLLGRGPVRVRGSIDATLGSGSMTVVHAYIPGTAEPDREVLITAHLDHPKWSANDNASGAGALLEMVRTLRALIGSGKLAPPRRTLHFMWVPEINGTMAYVTRHPEARRCGTWDDPRPPPSKGRCILANLNLDMVGEDTVKTRSRFYATRMPESVPSYLDALLEDVLAAVREANLYAPTGSRNLFVPEMVPYSPNSDHDVFLGLGIPASMLGHAPDWTHHSSADTLDNVDATELLRVGVFASAAAMFLADATPQDWQRLWPRALAGQAARAGERLARLLGSGGAVGQPVLARLQHRLRESLAALPSAPPAGRLPEALLLPGEAPPAATSRGPRRRVLLPFDVIYDQSLFDKPDPADLAWLYQQRERFADSTIGFEALLFEAVNFMDGHRTAADIATELAAEFRLPIDTAWVERLLQLLTAQQLVTTP
jgi:hypothetical protein